MQVLFSEEFGYDLKSQVKKSPRKVSEKPMQFTVAVDQLATSNGFQPPSPLFSEIQDLSPGSICTTRPCSGTCSHGKL